MKFKLLGPLAVIDQGRNIYIPAGRQRTVLAHLLLRRDKAMPADELIEDLWDGRPPSGARAALYSSVTRLRESLGDNGGLIRTMPHGYIIDVAEDDVDLQTFSSRHARGQRASQSHDWHTAAEQFGSALDLWRGEPLVDVESETLHRKEVPVLQELRLSALSGRIEADLSLGRHTAVVPELRRLANAWPEREEFTEQLMLALYRSRRRSEALAAYREVREYLVRELGVEPGAELQRLHERILAGEETGPYDDSMAARGTVQAVPPPVGPAELPATVADFTGRHKESEELVRVLTDAAAAPDGGPGCVIAVSGPCGVGKTAFAVHIAHQVKDCFPDGQVFVGLHGSTEGDRRPRAVLARLARALGIEESRLTGDIDERSALIRSAMTGRRMLVLLDDARDAAQVRPLLPGTPSCAVIVTSRRRLDSLTVSQRVTLSYLNADESQCLLAEIVGAQRIAVERPAVEELLSICAGLPLALRFAGQRIASRPGWSVQHLADGVADRRRWLSRLQVGDLTIRGRLDASYAELRRLSGPASGPARDFRLLGLWQGTDLSLPAAAALLGKPCDQTEDDLELLVDFHLLESHSEALYRFHALTSCYARERAERDENPAERSAAVRRLLLWYLRTVQAAASVMGADRGFGGARSTARTAEESGIAPLTFGSPEAARGWLGKERLNMAAAIGEAAFGPQLELAAALRTILGAGHGTPQWASAS